MRLFLHVEQCGERRNRLREMCSESYLFVALCMRIHTLLGKQNESRNIRLIPTHHFTSFLYWIQATPIQMYFTNPRSETNHFASFPNSPLLLSTQPFPSSKHPLSPFLPIRQHNMRFTLYYGWTHYSCPFQKPYPTICSEIRVILPRSLPPFFTPDYSLQTINEVSHYYRWSSEWFG